MSYDPFYWYEREVDRDFEERFKGEDMNKVEIDLEAITQRMDELKDAKARYTFELKQVEKEIEKEELKLIALLDQTGTDEMQYGCYTFGWKMTVRNAFDQKLFGQDYPDLLAKYKVPKGNKVFEFKINK